MFTKEFFEKFPREIPKLPYRTERRKHPTEKKTVWNFSEFTQRTAFFGSGYDHKNARA